MKITCPNCGFQGLDKPVTDAENDELEKPLDMHAYGDGVIPWYDKTEEPCNGFYLLEHIKVYRRIKGVDERRGETRLVVDGRYQTGEGYDDGEPISDMTIECRRCLHEFPVPEEFHRDPDWR